MSRAVQTEYQGTAILENGKIIEFKIPIEGKTHRVEIDKNAKKVKIEELKSHIYAKDYVIYGAWVLQNKNWKYHKIVR